jgi:hypothetical protein
MTIHSYDGEDYDPDSSSIGRTYYSGRVAWKTGRIIKVTTLATGITTQYLNPDNEPVFNFWLGNDLLVAKPYRYVSISTSA